MKSLYSKFVIITASIMLLSSVLAFLGSNLYYQQKLKPSNDAKNTEIALDIAEFINENPHIQLSDYLENIAEVGYQIYLVDAGDTERFFGAAFRDTALKNEVKAQVLNGEIYHGMRQFPKQTFVTGFFANELTNTIGVPITHNSKSYALFLRPDIKLLFNEMHLLLAWLLALTILLSIVLVLFSTNYLVKPISSLTAATKALAAGNFHPKLQTKRNDELGELSKSFLQMAQKLEQLDDMRKEFISNISHDIQSPLSSIKGYTGLLEQDSLTSEEKVQYISVINSEINRLSILTKQLLLLASLDRNEDMMKAQRFHVGKQIENLIKTHQWAIRERDLMITYSLPDITITGDPSLLSTVWDNLLTNAMKYNKPGGTIDVSIKVAHDYLVVSFQDTGIGLSTSQQKRIFDRFYRADTARSQTVEGTGLGLSIVSTIIKLHNGEIKVDSQEGEGTLFQIKLPIS
ncbi:MULTISPECIES: sensor histidine kinase [Priestia]|uniref:sensor histidine kinase n=1 Tax=Priestia TaxID=2800373 RepID=UPI00119CEFCE|nr:HAMP domain-containing sensor histidine kinase [Priestia flexa]